MLSKEYIQQKKKGTLYMQLLTFTLIFPFFFVKRKINKSYEKMERLLYT